MKTFPMRSIQTVLAISSFVFLTAAKGDGCGTSVIEEPTLPIDPPICAAGSHIETVCDGGPVVIESTTSSSSGGFGTATGSSGSFGSGGASPGTTVGAGGSASTSGGVGGFSTTGGGPDVPPSPGICYDTCVPDQACAPGSHAEVVCAVEDIDYSSSSSSGSASGSSSSGGGVAEPYPGDCEVTCVPDAICPPGTHAEPVCGGVDDGVSTTSSSSSSSSGSSSGGSGSGGYGSGEELPYPGDCPLSCVPDQCPPDMIAVEVCDDSCDGMPTCWIECQAAVPPDGT